MTDEPTLPTSPRGFQDQLDVDLQGILLNLLVACNLRDATDRERNDQAGPDGPWTMSDASDLFTTARARLRAIIDGHRVALSDDDYEYGVGYRSITNTDVIYLVNPSTLDAPDVQGRPRYRRIRPGYWERLP